MLLKFFKPRSYIEPNKIKAESERKIKALGGKICDWLPAREETQPRDSAEVADRALALHAMIEIAYGAPVEVIAAWIKANQLDASVSQWEKSILAKRQDEISSEDQNRLSWSIEALWALVWAGKLINRLDVDQPISDNIASLLPDLRRNQDATIFRSRFALRPYPEIYAMLDLYYRAHWYAVDGLHQNYPTSVFNPGEIIQRRQALEWIIDHAIPDWDSTPQDT